MKKVEIIIIVIFIILIISVGAILYYNNSVKKDVYKTQEECERVAGFKCSYSSCESNCGIGGRFKGWVPVSTGMQSGNVNVLNVICQNDSDCKEYISNNTCEVYCARNNEQNQTYLSYLPVNCDSTLWDKPYLGECRCIENSCEFID